MRKILTALFLSTAIVPAHAINFLTTDTGEYLTDSRGGRLVFIGDAGGVLQLRSFPGKVPNQPIISLITDFSDDFKTLSVRGFVNEPGFTVISVTVYLNNVVLATCHGAECAVDIDVSKMVAGNNEILVAYFNSAHVGKGTSFKIGKP